MRADRHSLLPGRRAEIGRILRFALVGASVAGVYAALYALFRWAGTAPWAASLAGFALAVLWQYWAQTVFTFRSPLSAPGQALRFAVTVALGAATASAITGLIGPALALPEAAAVAAVVLWLPVQNYLVFRTWVYRPGPAGGRAAR